MQRIRDARSGLQSYAVRWRFCSLVTSLGPAGEVTLSWRRAIERPVSVNALHRALPDLQPEQIATWLDAGQGAPLARAAAVLQIVLEERSRDIMVALVLADVALAQALGWTHMLPLLRLGHRSGLV